jgi:hypothetical protein
VGRPPVASLPGEALPGDLELATVEVPIREGRVTVPEAGLWTLVVLDGS